MIEFILDTTLLSGAAVRQSPTISVSGSDSFPKKTLNARSRTTTRSSET